VNQKCSPDQCKRFREIPREVSTDLTESDVYKYLFSSARGPFRKNVRAEVHSRRSNWWQHFTDAWTFWKYAYNWPILVLTIQTVTEGKFWIYMESPKITLKPFQPILSDRALILHREAHYRWNLCVLYGLTTENASKKYIFRFEVNQQIISAET
jgi:hypothetical protein